MAEEFSFKIPLSSKFVWRYDLPNHCSIYHGFYPNKSNTWHDESLFRIYYALITTDSHLDNFQKKTSQKGFGKFIGKYLFWTLFFKKIVGCMTCKCIKRKSIIGVILKILRNLSEQLFYGTPANGTPENGCKVLFPIKKTTRWFLTQT